MFLVLLALLLALPFIEVWTAIQVADVIGGGPTLLLLILMSAAGVVLLKREGTSVWRAARDEIAAGRPPTNQLLDGAMVLVGGISLMIPGFVSGVFGLLLLLPPVRALLRPLALAWMTARAARAVRSGAMSAVFVQTVVDADGVTRQRTSAMGDVIDAEGWDVVDDPLELQRPVEPREPTDRGSVDPNIIDVDGPPDGT